MKKKTWLLVLAVLVLAGGAWFARAAWRAHRQMVTLHVHNAPLVEVLGQIESQIWRKIRAEKSLDARITLNVTDMPLATVMDRIAEQSGAHWSTVYAVYHSARALDSLDSALRGDGQLEPVGWTKVAPQPPPEEPFAEDETSKMPRMGGGFRMIKRSGGSGGGGGGGGAMFMSGGNGKVEMWSPEQLLAESQFTNQLGKDSTETIDAAAATEAARKIDGKWTTFVALNKSSMGISLMGGDAKFATGAAGPGAGPNLRMLSNPFAQNNRFARLTPEQRVQWARQRQSNQNFVLPPPQ